MDWSTSFVCVIFSWEMKKVLLDGLVAATATCREKVKDDERLWKQRQHTSTGTAYGWTHQKGYNHIVSGIRLYYYYLIIDPPLTAPDEQRTNRLSKE